MKRDIFAEPITVEHSKYHMEMAGNVAYECNNYFSVWFFGGYFPVSVHGDTRMLATTLEESG